MDYNEVYNSFHNNNNNIQCNSFLLLYFMVYNNCGDFILELVALCVLCILENNQQSIEHSIFYFVVIIRRRSKKRKRFLWRVDNPNRNTM